MTIPAGARLGPYEILAPLGAGGMGEVYRARDTQLERDVAIKLIADALARDAEYLARFEREARVLASLNHPGIAAIYGIEERDGLRFLVLELVEGQGLDERLAAGALPSNEALGIASQVAEALAAAHEKGVIHRDLKPSNVRINAVGRAKVLDFGLAKTTEEDAGGGSRVTTSPAAMTAAGTILGSPAYMSPEQARGKALDKRTDLWSFGCLLYEMLAGRRAFEGETVSDCIAAILHEPPDWTALPRATPAAVRRILRRCLEKDPEQRLRDAADARLEIDEMLQPARRGRRRRARPAAAASTPRLTQLTLARALEESPVFSPDGEMVAFAADVEGVRKIITRPVAGGAETAVTSGPFDDIQPSWSPDGGTIVFVRAREPRRKLEPGDVFGAYWGGDVWIVDRASRRESRLVEDAYNPSFAPDGSRIAVDAPWAGQRRIWLVDANGRNPKQLTSDVSEAIGHVRPRWSPDGRRIVFQNMESTKFDVRVVDLESQRLVWVTNDLFQDIQPVWSPSGRFVYFSSYRSGGLNLWRIAVSAGGKPRGAPQQLTTGAGQDVEAALSANPFRLAFTIRKQNADLWTLSVDPATGRPTGPPQEAIATNREDSRGAWSPDGRTIAFNSDRSGDMNIWIHDRAEGSTRQLTSGRGGDYQANWSPDGRIITFFSSRSGTANIWMVEVGSCVLTPLTETQSLDINPFFSPDGRSIAFESDRSGRLEVWMMDADGSRLRQLTRTGVAGHFLRWAKDSKAIFFRRPGSRPETMHVDLDGGEPRSAAEVAGGAHMSFSPDGSLIMDVVAHKTLWVSPLHGGKPAPIFEFDDPDARIDYPVWSPDGRSILFDRFRPQGGDIWMMEGFE
ncbi:MAG TPA: protein kinase [Thermoanaerobaculia bacterium]|jgi:Tol biopolymer transport system component